MSTLRQRFLRVRDESGAVLVIVTFALPILLFLVTFVVDIGNWYEHRQHLQTQADAAAFAGGDSFQACFGGGGDTVIFGAATDYAGSTGDYRGTLFTPGGYSGTSHNAQVGGTGPANVMALYQSPTYWQQSSPVDGTLATQASPCASPYVFDVKSTEVDLPLFIPYLAKLLPPVNAHARVQLHPSKGGNPTLPLAVPDVAPTQVAVSFLDKKTGDELATCSGADMVAGTSCTFLVPSGPVASGGLSIWTRTDSTSVTVPAKGKAIVRVALGSAVGSCAAGVTSSTYRCFDLPAADLTAPVQQVWLDSTPYSELAGGTHDYARIDVGLAEAYSVNTPCSDSSGGSYSCPTDPTRLLRFASSTGSDTYAFDCGTINDPTHTGGDLYQQVRWGCANTYSINPTGTCPDASADPADCADISNVGSGDKLGQIRSAMTDRLAPNGVCSADNYPDISTPGDPRLVTLIVTSLDAYDGNGGSRQVPVLQFAAFYITGWDGAPSGCDNEPYPGDPKDESHGDIWGHFVKYVDPNAIPDTNATCDPSALTPCVPVLTQ